ncbi:MAG TPA: cytochrome c [Terriglobales bacterium]|nr:cytochrome c [Terriglobales bacterium]
MAFVLSYFWALRECVPIVMARVRSSPSWVRASVVVLTLLLTGCDVERRKSDAELGLNPQQSEGRKHFDNYCARCHEPYSSRGKNGPSLKGIFKQQYLPLSGLPANDDRVGDIVKHGRSKMEGFGNVMSDEQVKDLLAYLHTL